MSEGVASPTRDIELVGISPCMRQLCRDIRRIAPYDINVLVQGESGTGKEVVARAIHRLSPRREKHFVGVNCAAIHETLLESELFGHEAGAFTGAQGPTLGIFRAAEGGTILLDEVEDMGPPLQSKLLRVLEERAVVPVGGTQAAPVDVRIIAATNQDLAQAVQDGRFRPDLYYRLNVVALSIPPLRERRADIPPLIRHMLERVADALGVPVKQLSEQALRAMIRHDWPGNVRELGNAIQHAYVLGAGDVIHQEDMPATIAGAQEQPEQDFPSLRQAIGRHVRDALAAAGGARGEAARLLGVDRKTLRRMVERYSLA